ncbi:MAG: hypothetical protein R3B07_32100 [Polyangiaceae bacterium]
MRTQIRLAKVRLQNYQLVIMQHTANPEPELMDRLRHAVRKHGLNHVAARLGVNRNTLATVLAGGGRAGSIVLVVQRATERPQFTC